MRAPANLIRPNPRRHHGGACRGPRQSELTLGSRWQGPTLAEFIERVEREFSASADLTGLLRDGGGSDCLAPGDVRDLCAQLGVPAEDFGVEP